MIFHQGLSLGHISDHLELLPIGLFSCVQLRLDLPCKIFAAPIGGPVQAHFLAVVYGTVIVFPNAVLGTDGADGGIGGVIPMLAKGAAVVNPDVDGAEHIGLLLR